MNFPGKGRVEMVMEFPGADLIESERPRFSGRDRVLRVKLGIDIVSRVRAGGRPHRGIAFVLKSYSLTFFDIDYIWFISYSRKFHGCISFCRGFLGGGGAAGNE